MMKKHIISIFVLFIVLFLLVACGQSTMEAEIRAVYTLDRVHINGLRVGEGNYVDSRLTFIGEERGGTVIIRVGGTEVQASINPSRVHPSFEQGYWHHHLYAGTSEAGSPRISFLSAFPDLGIDINPEATNNTQSNYQHGNLHYVVATGEYRLRFSINGAVHDLIFVRTEG